MATPTPLFCHTATVMTMTTAYVHGRPVVTWTPQTVTACRFSSPHTSTIPAGDGAVIDHIDATVYVGPELEPVLASHDLPIRFVSDTPGWTGTFAMKTPACWYTGDSATVHHGTCSLVRVRGDDAP